MNKRFLFLSIFASAFLSISFVGLFIFFFYNYQKDSANQIASDIHSSYLREIIYNYKNDLVSGNYRSFRNQIATMRDRNIFTSYRLVQANKVIDSTDDYESNLKSNQFSRIVVPIWFDEEKLISWGQVELLVNIDTQIKLLTSFSEKIGFAFFLILIVALTIVALYTFIWQKLSVSLTLKLNSIFSDSEISRKTISDCLWGPMLNDLRVLKSSNDQLLLVEQEMKMQNILIEVSRQVAHDIRSPLSALNMVLSTIREIPAEKINLLLGAANRINSIADDLLFRGKLSADIGIEANKEIECKKDASDLTVLLENIVLEKKAQYFSLSDLTFDLDFSEAFGTYVKCGASELLRVFSNLINNSIEALEDCKGNVSIRVVRLSDDVMIIIRDNGKGVPEHLLSRLGDLPLTFGKEGSTAGSGLGVYHAKQTVLNLGGQFNIHSVINTGTMIEIKLPCFEVPIPNLI